MIAGGDGMLEAEIGRHDWSGIKSFHGDASALPAAIKALVFAETEQAAKDAYWRIDNVALIQGRLSQSAAPLTSCLLVGLDLANQPAQQIIIDLLATIAGGYDEHVDSAAVGPIAARDCTDRMTDRLDRFIAELHINGNPSCVDILLMCATYDDTLQEPVAGVFRDALNLPSCARITNLIETSLADLEDDD